MSFEDWVHQYGPDLAAIIAVIISVVSMVQKMRVEGRQDWGAFCDRLLKRIEIMDAQLLAREKRLEELEGMSWDHHEEAYKWAEEKLALKAEIAQTKIDRQALQGEHAEASRKAGRGGQ